MHCLHRAAAVPLEVLRPCGLIWLQHVCVLLCGAIPLYVECKNLCAAPLCEELQMLVTCTFWSGLCDPFRS